MKNPAVLSAGFACRCYRFSVQEFVLAGLAYRTRNSADAGIWPA
jgi:hypothetical protein